MNSEVATFTSTTLNNLTLLASLVASFFLAKGGYLYITSSGRPEALDSAKRTIRNALIGLVLVLSANTFVSILNNAFTTPTVVQTTQEISLNPIEPVEPEGGLTQVLMDAIGSLLKILFRVPLNPSQTP